MNPGSLAPEPWSYPRCSSSGKKGKGGCQGRRRWASEVTGDRACLPGGKRPLQIPHGCDVLGAFYSEKLPGLSRAGRIVVLNTNLYYTSNEQTAGMADPSQQFQWLDDVLTNASQAGEMVRAPCSSPPSLGSLPEQVPHFGTDTHPLRCSRHRASFISLTPKRAFSILTTASEAGTHCTVKFPVGQ